MTIRHLRIFAAVASLESVTRAAEALYLTQPTVSVAVRELEAHYGVRLFDRISQRLRITEAGRSLLDYATHLLDLYDEMERSLRHADSRGTIRLGASTNAAIALVPALARRFQGDHPDIRLQVHVSTTEALERLLLESGLDLAIVGGAVQSPDLRLVPLRDQRYRAVCAPGAPLAGQEVPLARLAREPLLLREPGSGIHELLRAALAQAGVPLQPAWESASQAALVSAARAGLGVTLLPEELAEEELAAGRLAPVRVPDMDFRTPLRLAYHRSKYLSPALEAFLAAARAFAPAEDAG